MRYWFCSLVLLVSLVLLPGCGPELSKNDLGTVVNELPKVAGADEPYHMSQLDVPEQNKDKKDNKAKVPSDRSGNKAGTTPDKATREAK
jgi:hypothetical protein